MAKVDLTQNPTYLEWASQQTGWTIDPHDKTWITNLSNDEVILGVAFFHTWRNRGNVELGLVLNKNGNGMSKQFIRQTFRYAFLILNVARLTTIVYTTPQLPNCDWINQLIRIGGKFEVELKNWFGPGVNGTMIRFTPEEMAKGPFGRLIFGEAK